jgi:hypothetical protein
VVCVAPYPPRRRDAANTTRAIVNPSKTMRRNVNLLTVPLRNITRLRVVGSPGSWSRDQITRSVSLDRHSLRT